MPDGIETGIISFISTAIGATVGVLSFRTRIIRSEADIQKLDKDKADKITIKAVLDAHGRELGEIKSDIKTLLERREKDRN